MTESGVFVDVNCEEHHRVALAVAVWVATSTALQVQGYLSPMDIDMMASASLCKGYEAMHVHALGGCRLACSEDAFQKHTPANAGDGVREIGEPREETSCARV